MLKALSFTLRAIFIAALTVLGVSYSGLTNAQDLPRATPESLGFSSDGLAHIEPLIQREIDGRLMAGAVVMLAKDRQVFYENVAGYQDLRGPISMSQDTLFRIHSMTKPVTGVAGLILVEEGKLRLTDPVSKYIPSFENLRVYVSGEGDGMVTRALETRLQIRHLFSHTSGFAYRTPAGKSIGPDNHETLTEFVESLSHVPLLFQPGTNYQYSISNDILGHVIEVVSQQRLGEFMAERIFQPLGMVDTAFWVPEDKLSRLAVSYDRSENGLIDYDRPETSAIRDRNRPHSGGGGLISTAADYLRFAQMLANGGQLNGTRILSAHGVKLFSSNHLPKGVETDIAGQAYGLAVGVDVDLGRKGVMGNEGTFHWSGAANTHFWVDPKSNIVGVWMTQARPFDFDYAHDLRNLTYQALINPGPDSGSDP